MTYITRPKAAQPRLADTLPANPPPPLAKGMLQGESAIAMMKRMAAQECARMGGVPGAMPPAVKDGKPLRRETPAEIAKALLTRLRASPGCSLARLAKAIDAPQPTIAPVVEGLLAAGLIEEKTGRRPGSALENLVTYWLTEKGLIHQKGGKA